MSFNELSPFFRAWYRWKTLRLPWRTHFLVGHDLEGNTFWEFRDLRGSDSGRWRRIMRAPRRVHHTEVKVSPAWHQWLRHTRHEPPSIEEQRADVVRQARMKVLAAEADARWAAKPSFADPRADAPGAAPWGQRVPALSRDPAETAAVTATGDAVHAESDADARTENEDVAGRRTEQPTRQETWKRMRQQQVPPSEANPWAQSSGRGGPSEKWQPKAWNPAASGSASKRS